MILIYLDKSIKRIIIDGQKNVREYIIDEINTLPGLENGENYIFVGYYTQFTYELMSRVYYELQGKRHCYCQIFPIFPRSICGEYYLDFQSLTELYVLDALNAEINEEDINLLTNHPYKNLILAVHGEGTHIKLGNNVLCALSGKVEKNSNGRVIVNGCTENSCRRFRGIFKNRLRCSDIKCEKLYLLGCNSGIIAGDLYNSSSSLARGFLEQGVKEYLGCLELHAYSTGDIKLVEFLILEEYSMSEICYILNQIELRKSNRTPFCFFSLDILNINLKRLFLKKFKLKEAFYIKDNEITVLDIKEGSNDIVYSYQSDKSVKLYVWVGLDIMLLFNVTEPCIIKIFNSTKLYENIQQRFTKMFKWISFWVDYFDSFSNIEMVSELMGILRKIKRKKGILINIKNDSVCSFERLQALSNWFQIEISNLGKKIYKLFVMQFSITNFERTILLESSVFISKDLLCNRCNHNMFVYSLKENNSLYYSYCGICGIRSISSFKYKIDTYMSINSSNCFNIVILLDSTMQLKNEYIVYIELYDKTKESVVQKILKTVKFMNGRSFVPVNQGDISGRDLHTYRGLIIDELEPIYFKGRFLI